MRVLAFDVFGTLIDPSGIREALPAITKDPEGFATTWRRKQLEYTFLLTSMNRYLSFSEVTGRALQWTATRYGMRLTSSQRRKLVGMWSSLPPFPEARQALIELQSQVSLVVLSNGDPLVLADTLRHANLHFAFKRIISASEVRAFKPSRAIYVHAAKVLGLPPRDLGLVSSNAFDVVGAKSAGLSAIWVNRSGVPWDDLGVAPDFEVPDLTAVRTVKS